jgi:hypothetical protein
MMGAPFVLLPMLRNFGRSMGVIPKPDAGAKAISGGTHYYRQFLT